MAKVTIFTDSTCDLPQNILDEFNIKSMPLHVSYGDKTFDDDDSLANEKLYQLVDELGVMPKTAGITPDQAIDAMRPYVEDGSQIFYLGLSASMSTTFNSIRLAAEELGTDKVIYLDSKNLSTGTGLMLLKACGLRDQGLDAQQIKEKIEKYIPLVKTQFVVRSMDYLYKGGRINRVTKTISNVLRFRPMIVVRDGRMKVGKINIGFMTKAVDKMAKIFLKDIPYCDHEYVFVTDSYQAEQSLDVINERLEEGNVKNIFKRIIYTKAGATISSHCGPGSIGILYIMKDDIHDEELDDIENK